MRNALLLVLLLTIPGASLASPPLHLVDCAKAADEAYRRRINHLVVSFEGLAMPARGPVFGNLISPLLEENPVTFSSLPLRYTQASFAHECVLLWKKIHGRHFKLTLIGHSFGGGIALQSLLESLKQSRVAVQNVLTLDPRNMTSGFFCPSAQKGREKFQKPAHVARYLNFYQCGGGLPGEHVAGVRNMQITGYSHISLPQSPVVKSALKKLLLP